MTPPADADRRSRLISFGTGVVLTVAVIGFFYGTSGYDYDLEPKLTVHEESEDVRPPPTYSEMRARTALSEEKVAKACVDCHKDLLTDAEFTHRREHPIDVEPPADARLQTLRANGGILVVKDDGSVRLSCRTCHWPHAEKDDARLVVPADDLCLMCHRHVEGSGDSYHPLDMEITPEIKGRIEDLGGVLGPDGLLSCISCHVPHHAGQESLIRVEAEAGPICAVCHDDKRHVMEGAHGVEGCPKCHGMHEPPDLEKGIHLPGVGPQPCLDCHTSDYEDAPQIHVHGSHPLGVEVKDGRNGDLPLARGRMACTTCHNQHSAADRLLRLRPPDLCLTCHPEKYTVKGTDHDTTVVPAGDSEMTCVSCHRAHAVGASSRMVATKRGEGLNPASGRCLSCHDGSTDATDPGPGSHPSKEDRAKEERAREAIYDGPIPFFTPAGLHTNDLANAEPACSTCHNPHKWNHRSEGGEGAADGDRNNSFLRDSKLVVQLCSRCHGKETGLKNFRNFHDQSYRDSRDVW